MRSITLTQEQQQQFAIRMDEEYHKITISWDNELSAWHPIAIKSLDFASPVGLRVPQEKFKELLQVEKAGVNMNVVAVLLRSMSARNAHQMEMSFEEWAGWLEINKKIQDRWDALSVPVQKSVFKEFEIMAGKPKLLVAEA